VNATSPPLLFAVGAFVGLLGALIRFYGASSLIAGYDPDRVTDEEGLTRFVGTNTLYVAALTLGLAAAEHTAPADWHWAVYAACVFVLAVRTVSGARGFESEER
jgi:hypothetical protein